MLPWSGFVASCLSIKKSICEGFFALSSCLFPGFGRWFLLLDIGQRQCCRRRLAPVAGPGPRWPFRRHRIIAEMAGRRPQVGLEGNRIGDRLYGSECRRRPCVCHGRSGKCQPTDCPEPRGRPDPLEDQGRQGGRTRLGRFRRSALHAHSRRQTCLCRQPVWTGALRRRRHWSGSLAQGLRQGFWRAVARVGILRNAPGGRRKRYPSARRQRRRPRGLE